MLEGRSNDLRVARERGSTVYGVKMGVMGMVLVQSLPGVPQLQVADTPGAKATVQISAIPSLPQGSLAGPVPASHLRDVRRECGAVDRLPWQRVLGRALPQVE